MKTRKAKIMRNRRRVFWGTILMIISFVLYVFRVNGGYNPQNFSEEVQVLLVYFSTILEWGIMLLSAYLIALAILEPSKQAR